MTVAYAPTRIEVFRPHIGEEEIAAVAEVMRSGWIGRGPKVEEFESQWAAHIGVNRENVVSVGCCTEALYQVMQELSCNGVSRLHSEVIIPDNSFIGTASAIQESKLYVQLCDIRCNSLNPTYPDYMARRNDSTVGIVYQHYGGFESKLDDIRAGVRHWPKVALIEDFACHPMGRPVGDYAVYSFDAMKVLTCGDGGMVYCRDAHRADSIRQATRLGMDTASGKASNSDRWWEFTAHTPGRRSMMNDIGAAIGLVQLGKLPKLVERRRALWEIYQEEFSGLTWLSRPPKPPADARSSFYTYWIQVMKPEWRDRLAVFLRERGIYTTYRYWPVHRAYGLNVLDCPGADWAADHTLNLPLHPGLSDDDVEYVCDTIAEFGRTL